MIVCIVLTSALKEMKQKENVENKRNEGMLV